MFDTGKRAAEIIAAEGLAQITDTSAIEKIARAVVAKNPDNVAKYRAGNEGVFKFFVGQVMRETRGQANPQLVNEIAQTRAQRIIPAGTRREKCSKKATRRPPSVSSPTTARRFRSPITAASNLILYFYPKANTTGCTHEAVEFRNAMEQFKAAEHGCGRLQRGFRRGAGEIQGPLQAEFPALADTEFEVIEPYGARRMKTFSREIVSGNRALDILD